MYIAVMMVKVGGGLVRSENSTNCLLPLRDGYIGFPFIHYTQNKDGGSSILCLFIMIVTNSP